MKLPDPLKRPFGITLAALVALVAACAAPSVFAIGSAQEDEPATARPGLDDADRAAAFALAEEYKTFLDVARTELDTVREVLRFAREKGYADLFAAESVKPGDRLYAVNRDRTIALLRVGTSGSGGGVRISGAHIDSPRIDLKGRPVYGAQGFAMLQTVYHGGIKKYQWASLPLMLTGRVDRKDGSAVDIEIGRKPDDPVFVIPDLAPHVDRDYRGRKASDALKGEELDPIAASEGDRKVVERVLGLLEESYGVTKDDLVSAELSLVPALPPRDVGLDRALVGGYGQDDRLSAFCAYRALEEAEAPDRTAIAFLVDNEETGSGNNTGANSSWLRDVIAHLLEAEGGAFDENDLRRVLRSSEVLSADTTTGVNPLFPGVQEAGNASRLGRGVAIKLYGRGNNAHSEFIARIRAVLDGASIPWQTHTYKVDVGGGGTIARFLSRENMDVIDVGVPILSMHSVFSLSSKADVWWFHGFMKAFFEGKAASEGTGGGETGR